MSRKVKRNMNYSKNWAKSETVWSREERKLCEHAAYIVLISSLAIYHFFLCKQCYFSDIPSPQLRIHKNYLAWKLMITWDIIGEPTSSVLEPQQVLASLYAIIINNTMLILKVYNDSLSAFNPTPFNLYKKWSYFNQSVTSFCYVCTLQRK